MGTDRSVRPNASRAAAAEVVGAETRSDSRRACARRTRVAAHGVGRARSLAVGFTGVSTVSLQSDDTGSE